MSATGVSTAGLVDAALKGARVDAASMSDRRLRAAGIGAAGTAAAGASGGASGNTATAARPRFDTRDRVEISNAALARDAQAARGRAAGRGASSMAPDALGGSLTSRARAANAQPVVDRDDGRYGLDRQTLNEIATLPNLRSAFPALADQGRTGGEPVRTAVDGAAREADPAREAATPTQVRQTERVAAAPGAGSQTPLPGADVQPAAERPWRDSVQTRGELRQVESPRQAREQQGPEPAATPSQNRDVAPQSEPTSSNPAARGEPAGTQDRRPEASAADTDRAEGADGQPLSEGEMRQVEQLKQRDQEVRTHENAHVAAGGRYVTRGASYDYQQGPDGKRYAVGGEVGIDTSAESDPAATIRKMQQVRAAALAPADPSSQDRSVAAAAAQAEQRARVEMQTAARGDAPQLRTVGATDVGLQDADAGAGTATQAQSLREKAAGLGRG